MRNVKLLWGAVVFLLVVTVGLTGIVARLLGTPRAEGEAVQQEEQKEPENKVVIARIGDREIKEEDLTHYLKSRHGAELLNQMIDREAIQQKADATGLKLEREELDRELKRMQQGYDSEEQFYRAMKDQIGLSKDDLREDVYFKLLLEKIATNGIEVSDKEVDAYMQAHPEEFRSMVQVRFQQIISATLEQANKTIELAKGGRDFADLAKERSLDTATASDGGDMGWVDENDPFVAASILKAIHSLKVGEISKPVQMADGYAVVKLTDRKELNKGSQAEIRETLRKQLALQKAKPLKEVTQELRNERNVIIFDAELRK
ncbi:peptidyl-prolyl cis-trans isomerase [Paenibacillus sp. MBLB4367]|uniref:peptidyl-prolyl cis-trans isomerase n=1 Tax=Paenibacillus sp. MBLB4367 TaxID=3384767 RepID=UPI003907EE72